MEKYKLLCKKEHEEILRELFQSNNILLDQEAPVLLCEQGMISQDIDDLVIYFRLDKIATLLRIIRHEPHQQLSIIMGKKDENFVPIEIGSIVFFNACGNDTYVRKPEV